MRRPYSIGILFFLLAIVGFSLACQQPAPTAPPDTRAADERAIHDADLAFSKAAATKDLERWVSFYADDASVFLSNAPVLAGKEAIRKSLGEMMKNPGFAISWTPGKVEVARSGDLGYSTGAYEMTLNNPKGKPETDRGKYVTVWEKQADGSWKAVADISNSDLPLPTTKR